MKTLDLKKPITSAEQAAKFMQAVGGNVIFNSPTRAENGTPYVMATCGLDRGEHGNNTHAPTMVEAVEKLRERLLVRNESRMKQFERIKADAEERLAAAKRGELVLDGDIE